MVTNLQELAACFSKVRQSLEQKRLKQSFETLTLLLANLSDWQLKEKLSDLEENYRLMLRYLTDGVKDPQQEKIYHDLLRSIYQIADRTVMEIKTIRSWSYAYETRSALLCSRNETLLQLIERIDSLTERLALTGLLEEGKEKDRNLLDLEKERENIERKVFLLIWTSGLWTSEEENSWSDVLQNSYNPSTLQCLIVAATILNLEELFDARKIELLLTACENPNEEIRQRALTGVLLFLRRYDRRLYLYPDISSHLQHLSESRRFIRDLQHIILQFILSRETEKITRIMTEEIIPGMLKISPLLDSKIHSDDDLFGETGFDEKNPEWQTIIEESGLAERLQEFTDLQLEGADVMLSSFHHLKNFSFFNDIHHWFVPFVPLMRNKLNNDPNDFVGILLDSSFLCNSDKYSFYFTIVQMPQIYREAIMGQFSEENSSLKEMISEELPGSESEKVHPVARQFIQDLYRFYKLFPRRNNIEDVFGMKPEFYQTPSIAGFISDTENLTVIGEYYFHRNYFEEAADVFDIILRNTHDETLLQKRGYCLQMTGKPESALDCYLKADLINSDNSWIIKKMAYCYRTLKQYREALDCYRRVEQLNPDNLSIQLNIGHCYLKLKDYPEALKYYFKVEYLTDSKGKTWRPIAWCSFLTGKYKQALDYFTKIIADNPNDIDYLNAGHTCLAMGNNKEALQLYKSALIANGNSYDKFMETFTADVPDLLNAGVRADDIPVILDSLVYEI
jgi:tetratricopeptide (TPR) repeat protein